LQTKVQWQLFPFWSQTQLPTRQPTGGIGGIPHFKLDSKFGGDAQRDVVLTPKAIKDLVSVNRYVNESVKADDQP
jgi:hypothetical protein